MDEKFENDKELIQKAAEGCYYYKKDRRRLAMGFILERLVLPPDVDSYDIGEMVKYINQALNKGVV